MEIGNNVVKPDTYQADPNGNNSGKSYIVFGKTNSSAINLSAIADASNPLGGFVINGEAVGDWSGYSVSSAGDVNGDGLDDLIVGARYADPSGKLSAGKSYVIFGKTDTNAIDLAKLGGNSKYAIDHLGNENANTLTGTSNDEIFVAGAGDDTLTGNGGMDVFNAGSGKDSILINASNISALEQTGAGNRARVDGGGGVDTLKLDGAGLTLDLTKISNTRIQDIEIIDIRGSGNNTLKLNLNDLLDASTSTNILKVLGNSGDTVNTSGFVKTKIETENGITYDIYTHSDANIDAKAALWVQQGVSMKDMQRGFVINGEAAGDESGRSVSNAGDVNGDGLDDLIVSAFFADPNGKLSAGKSYVVFGKANSSAINLSAIADASNPTGGFVINGEARYDYSGWSVSSAGDVNGDGLDDLIVSGYQADPSGKSSAGKSYVIFGKTDTGAIDLANLGGDSKYVINYLGDKNANTLTGTSKDEIFVAGAGDDTLTGNGGMDVFNAGLGKDSILINASNISALEQTGAGNRARVDDGGGIDTLVLEGSDLTLDLTKISDRRIQDIEVIDITGSGDNTLKLNLYHFQK